MRTLLALMIFVLCTARAMAQPAAGEAVDFAQGRRLFVEHCSSCHGLALQGSAQAPPLINVDAVNVDFELRTGRMPAEVPWEQEFSKASPFTSRQIGNLVAYVMWRSSGNKTLPVVNTNANVKRGSEIFAENCQQCHGVSGHGDNVGYADVAPSLMDTHPQQIAEAVRMGPDVMPPFGQKTIDERGLNDLVSYVVFLQHAQYNPGGLHLANLGPVAEGFIGWVFGLGLLLLLVRRIGTTE